MVVDELDNGLARLNDLDVTWGFDLDAFLQERAQQAPAVCGTAETLCSSQRGAADASSAPAGTAETVDTMGSSQGAWTPPRSRQGGPKQSRRWVRLKGAWTPPRSRQGGSKATWSHQQPPAPAKATGKIPPRSCRGGQHTNSAAGDGSPRQYGAGPGVRVNAWRKHLLRSSLV